MSSKGSSQLLLLVNLACLCSVVLSNAPAKSPKEAECSLDFFRLPRRLEPTNYDLFIRPDMDRFTFEGKVAINVRDRTETDVVCNNLTIASSVFGCDATKIVLHADDKLTIESAELIVLEDTEAKPVRVKSFCRDKRNDLLVLTLDSPLGRDQEAQLKFKFSGPIRSDIHGIYRSESGPPNGPVEYVMATQFQAPHARKAFPCFDEPDFKATFRLTMEHAAHLKALSNTRAERETELSGRSLGGPRRRVEFARTPRMSTYLFAFVLGQFDRLEARTASDTQIAVWVAPGRGQLAEFSLRQAVRAYDALEEYFGIRQPLDKIDMVALRKLDAGAMENWGLVTFQEQYLRVIENDSMPGDVLYASECVTHELAHQWFGNLVTMRWWDDLWLNEGFATWMSQLINRQLNPEHDNELMFLIKYVENALAADAKASKTHPIRNQALQTADEIEDSFDMITYGKSAASLRMLNEFLGDRRFKAGVKRYLEAHLYGNTEAADLWRELEDVSGVQVRELMSSWLDQPGFPLVRVRLTLDGRRLELTQERFVSKSERKGLATKMAEMRQRWRIPVAVLVSDGARRLVRLKLMMSEAEDELQLPDWYDAENPRHWLKVNANFAGFYRVAYEDARLKQGLSGAVGGATMPVADRLNLVSDSTALYYAGYITLEQLDKVLSWFDGEDHDAVMGMMSRIIYELQAGRKSAPVGRTRHSVLHKYYLRRGRFQPSDPGAFMESSVRADVITRLLLLGTSEVFNDALNAFDRLASGRLRLPENFRQLCYMAVARFGNQSQIKRMIEMATRDKSKDEREELAVAITQAMSDTKAINKIRVAIRAKSGV